MRMPNIRCFSGTNCLTLHLSTFLIGFNIHSLASLYRKWDFTNEARTADCQVSSFHCLSVRSIVTRCAATLGSFSNFPVIQTAYSSTNWLTFFADLKAYWRTGIVSRLLWLINRHSMNTANKFYITSFYAWKLFSEIDWVRWKRFQE